MDVNTAAWIAVVVLGLGTAIFSPLLARRMAPRQHQPLSEARAQLVQRGIGLALLGGFASLGQGILGVVSLLLVWYLPAIIKQVQVRRGR